MSYQFDRRAFERSNRAFARAETLRLVAISPIVAAISGVIGIFLARLAGVG